MSEASEADDMLVGVYHFAYPAYRNDRGRIVYNNAIDEANWFLDIAGRYIVDGYLRPALDIEAEEKKDGSVVAAPHWLDTGGSAKPGPYPELTKWILEWMHIVESRTTVKPILYTTRDYAQWLDRGYVDAASAIALLTDDFRYQLFQFRCLGLITRRAEKLPQGNDAFSTVDTLEPTPADHNRTHGSAKPTIQLIMMRILWMRTAGVLIMVYFAPNHVHAYSLIGQLKNQTDKTRQPFFLEQLLRPKDQFIQ